ncbi:unnamed protein product [Trypanosoma congolense IL3000]|uniref:WGS project CAEQ00000000 data, annotated contig 2163 n=1 Tax=Trypanosoma congolense (strain IL3000) TaxID=1068625 RepID=F9WBY9_TRYCI|nr:unnamed protein product [Trypanosoma congolense IL3000]
MKRVLAPRVLNRQEGSVLKLETTRLQGWPLVRGYMPCNPSPNPQLFERVAGMRKGSISGSSWRCIEKKNPWGRALIPTGNAGAEARTHCMWPEDIKQQWKEIFIAAAPHLSQAPSHAMPLSQGHYAPFPKLVKSLSDTSVLHPSVIMNTRLEFMNCMAARRLGDWSDGQPQPQKLGIRAQWPSSDVIPQLLYTLHEEAVSPAH